MSKLLGDKLRTENVLARSGDSNTPNMKRQYVCVKCQVTFVKYPGMKSVGRGGLGYCEKHNPLPKPEPSSTILA